VPAGGADSYTLLAIPLTGAPATPISLPGTATSTTHATGGLPYCYVLAGVRGGAFGSTNLLCGFPGVSTLSAAESAWGQLQSAIEAGALGGHSLQGSTTWAAGPDLR